MRLGSRSVLSECVPSRGGYTSHRTASGEKDAMPSLAVVSFAIWSAPMVQPHSSLLRTTLPGAMTLAPLQSQFHLSKFIEQKMVEWSWTLYLLAQVKLECADRNM